MGNLSITEVRARLIHFMPYYGVAVMSVSLVETPGLGTMAVDKNWRLYYDPAVLTKWTNEECTRVMEHEINHLLRTHSARCQGRDPKKWNLAGDAEINDGIKGLPANCVYPSSYNLPDNETAEYYFDNIPESENDGENGDGEGEQGDGKGQGNGQGKPQDCGSGSGGARRQWEQEGGGVSAVEAEAIKRITAENVRSYGNAPGDLKRWAEEVLTPPRIPWHQILPAAVRLAIVQGTPQRFRYPSRRDHGQFILPRLISGKPSAALVVDTSGSVTDKDLALAISIIRQATSQADFVIYGCDTEAKRVERLAPGCFVGGGGTNMMRGVEVALEGRPKPQAIVIITDCYSPWDEEAPEVPVVILTTNPDQAPKWAKVITIEGD